MKKLALTISLLVVAGMPAFGQDSLVGLFPYSRYPSYAESVAPSRRIRMFEVWLIDIGGAGWVQHQIEAAIGGVLDRYVARMSPQPPDQLTGIHFFCQAENSGTAICGAFVYRDSLSGYGYYTFLRVARGQNGAPEFIDHRGDLNWGDRIGVAFSVTGGQARCVTVSTINERWDEASLSIAGLDGTSTCSSLNEGRRYATGYDISMATVPSEDGTDVYALVTAKGADDYRTLRLYRVTDKTESVPFARDEKGRAQGEEVVRVSPQSIAPLTSAKLMRMYSDLLKAPGAAEHTIEYPTPKMGAALKEYHDSLKAGEK